MLQFRRPALLLSLALLAPAPMATPAFAEEPLEFEADLVVSPEVLQKLVTEGTTLAGQGNHLEAALRFSDVVANGDPSAPVVQEAQFGLAVALYESGLYQSALKRFEPIVDAKDTHTKFQKSLPYLLFISRQIGPEDSVLYLIAEYDAALYPPDFADELNFLVGQYHFNQSLLEDALARFQKVGELHGELFVRAKYFEGVINVMQSRLDTAATSNGDVEPDIERLKAGAEAFKEVLRYDRDNGGNAAVRKIVTMSHVALGRLFFSTRQYDQAVKYYDQIASGSDQWLPSIFEVSWAYYQLQNYPRALGNLHTLNSPYFADQYFPESRVLQALILFYNCKYDEAQAVVKEFIADYYPLMNELSSEINQFADPNAFYYWLARLSKTENTEFSTRFKRIFNAALADRKLRRKFQFVTVINGELKRIEQLQARNPKAKAILDELTGELTAYRSLVVGEAGSLAQARLERVLKDLKGHLAGALKITQETIKAQRGALANSVKLEQQAAAKVKHPIVVDDEHFEWPFTGEYWKDELGAYIYDISSQCPVSGAPAAAAGN